MGNFYDPPTIGTPTYPNGYGSIEARLVRLDTHCWHEMQARLWSERRMHADLTAIRKELAEMRRDRAALILKVGFWAISGLSAALWALASNALTGASLGAG